MLTHSVSIVQASRNDARPSCLSEATRLTLCMCASLLPATQFFGVGLCKGTNRPGQGHMVRAPHQGHQGVVWALVGDGPPSFWIYIGPPPERDRGTGCWPLLDV